jgi:hypothetical protein
MIHQSLYHLYNLETDYDAKGTTQMLIKTEITIQKELCRISLEYSAT